jgi:hypothetical protein
MQTCKHCGSAQFDGTIFCSDCGASLVSSVRRETTTSLAPAATDTGIRAFVEDTVSAVSALPQMGMQTICLVVINSGRRIELDASDDLLIGRKDNARGIYPDVDLGLDGGYDSGVSRRHAVISLHQGTYLLEDLASANGTFVNGHRLGPQAPVQIKHGDEIKFGTLILRFEVM